MAARAILQDEVQAKFGRRSGRIGFGGARALTEQAAPSIGGPVIRMSSVIPAGAFAALAASAAAA